MFPSHSLCIQTACRQPVDGVRWKLRLMFWFDDCCHGSEMGMEEGRKHSRREAEQKIISLSLFHAHTHTHAHEHTSLTPHQPAVQSSRSSFGSVSCKGPSLGQQGGVQHSDSLSRTEACMANYVMRLLLKKGKPHNCTAATIRHLADSWKLFSLVGMAERPVQ